MSTTPTESVGSNTVTVALSTGATVAPQAAAGPGWRQRLATFFHEHGVTSMALVGFSAVFGAVAAFVLLVGHPGLGGLLGLVALAASELASVQQPFQLRDTTRLVRGVNPVVDLLMVAGFFGQIATYQAAPMILLAFLVLVLLGWLPMLPTTASGRTEEGGLWCRGERMAILLFAILLGRPLPALVMILAIGGLDAWLRLERMAYPLDMGPPPTAAALRDVVDEEGRLTTTARWVTIGLTLLAILALPQASAWRF